MHMLARILPKVFINLERRRRVCLALAPKKGALHEYLSTPLPNKDTVVDKVTILSLDFETTGLDASQEQLLSIGCVDICNGKIKLASGHHQVIRTIGQLKKDNVAIHKITDAEKERGAELKEAIDDLLRRMAGKVVLVHYAKVERNFLRQACLQIYGMVPPVLMIDTLAITKRRYDKHNTTYDPSRLRLMRLRSNFGLPNYHAHNALKDAIATAELLLAELQTHHKGLRTHLRKLL